MKAGARYIEKEMIFYTREYRHFKKMSPSSLIFLLICVLQVILIFTLFYSPITYGISQWTGKIISSVTGEYIKIASSEYFPKLGDIYFISAAGKAPGFTFSLISAIISLPAIIIAAQAKKNSKPLMIYMCMGLCVHLISSVFFIFWPEYFPYDLTQFAELYMKQQICVWIMIALIMGISTALVNETGAMKYVVFFVEVAVSLIYGVIRYAVFAFVIYYGSYIFMASLFFTFGVLFDFIQMVCVYSFFAKAASARYASAEGRKKWLWL